jgi:hypothetical protein
MRVISDILDLIYYQNVNLFIYINLDNWLSSIDRYLR